MLQLQVYQCCHLLASYIRDIQSSYYIAYICYFHHKYVILYDMLFLKKMCEIMRVDYYPPFACILFLLSVFYLQIYLWIICKPFR